MTTEKPSKVLTVPCDFAELSRIRSWVSKLASDSGARDEVVEQLALAVSELATNAIQYSSDDEIVVACSATVHSIVVHVSGADALAPLTDHELPSVADLTGRGLFIVGSVMDDVAVVELDGRRFVRCTKRID